MSSSENALLSKQDDQLFPYIDLPAIILSSNGLNNRALSEAAITDKQRDNMRCQARPGIDAAESEGLPQGTPSSDVNHYTKGGRMIAATKLYAIAFVGTVARTQTAKA